MSGGGLVEGRSHLFAELGAGEGRVGHGVLVWERGVWLCVMIVLRGEREKRKER